MEETMATVTAAKASCPFSDASTDFDPFDITDPFAFYDGRAPKRRSFSRKNCSTSSSPGMPISSGVRGLAHLLFGERTGALRPIGEEGKRIMREGGFTAYSGLSARVLPDHTRIRKLVQGCFGPRRSRRSSRRSGRS